MGLGRDYLADHAFEIHSGFAGDNQKAEDEAVETFLLMMQVAYTTEEEMHEARAGIEGVDPDLGYALKIAIKELGHSPFRGDPSNQEVWKRYDALSDFHKTMAKCGGLLKNVSWTAHGPEENV